jgi:K+-sensing histidine kinase KdpD
VKLTPCDIPEKKIGPGETLRDIQWVDLHQDWNSGISRMLSVIRPSEEPIEMSPELVEIFIHNMMSPLAAVVSSAEQLRDTLPERESRVVRDMEALARVATMGVMNFRAVTQLSKKSAVLYRSRVTIGYELQSIADVLRRQAAYKEVEIEVDHRLFLMPAVIDTSLMAQAFFNLLENAVKYSIKKSKIVVHGKMKSPGELEIEFINTGLPISFEDRRTIFEQGYRSQMARLTVAAGLGMGLYIARRIVEEHGGTLFYRGMGQPDRMSQAEMHSFVVHLPVPGPDPGAND